MWGVAEWTEHNNHNWFMEYKGSKSVLPYIPYGGVYGCVKTSVFCTKNSSVQENPELYKPSFFNR